jgi:hypothetical protein
LPSRHKYRISDEGSGGQHETICLKTTGDTVFIICDNSSVYLAIRKKWRGDVKRPLNVYSELLGKLGNWEIDALTLNLHTAQLEMSIVTVTYILNEIIRESQNKNMLNKDFPIVISFEAEFFGGKTAIFIHKNCSDGLR